MEELLPFNRPDYIADPYLYWERLRDHVPVYWCEKNRFWAISSPQRGCCPIRARESRSACCGVGCVCRSKCAREETELATAGHRRGRLLARHSPSLTRKRGVPDDRRD